MARSSSYATLVEGTSSDYLSFASTVGARTLSAFTITLWTNYGGVFNIKEGLFGNWAGGGTDNEILIRMAGSGIVECYVNVAGTQAGPANTPSGMSSGTWHHIALRWNGSNITAFIDGSAGTPVTLGGTWGAPTVDARVGYRGTSQLGLSGWIRDLAWFDYALPSAAIAAVAAGEHAVRHGPYNYWPLDGSGEDIVHGNTATMNGTGTFESTGATGKQFPLTGWFKPPVRVAKIGRYTPAVGGGSTLIAGTLSMMGAGI